LRILLTGGTGFIGSALLQKLEQLGHEVYTLVRYVSGGRYNYYGRRNSVFADIRDGEAVRKAVLSAKPEIVIHLAATTAVSFSFLNPADVFQVNTLGTIHLAEASREAGVEQMIFASTSEYYGNQKSFPIKEDAIPNATSPYAVSKIAAENYLWLMHRLYDFPVTVMRPFNSFGRANVDNRHYVVERAITGALEKGVINLHNPKPVREFVFREDHADAYLCALGRKEAVGEAFNVCYGVGYTIEEMANKVAEIVSSKFSKMVEINFMREPDRPMDIDKLVGDSTKIRRILGWKPKYNLETGLEKAINEWAWLVGIAPTVSEVKCHLLKSF
jgi:dTDP-glucose 4,6-dehydratase